MAAAKARSYASRLCRPQAAWQCRHCRRECSALKSVKGSKFVEYRLSRFSPSLRSGARASPTMRTTRGSGQYGRPKNMKIALQLFVGSATIHVFWSWCPGPRAAGRDCEALKNVKSPTCLKGGFSRSSPEHGSGVRLHRPCVRHESRKRCFASLSLTASFPLLGLSVDGYWPCPPG